MSERLTRRRNASKSKYLLLIACGAFSAVFVFVFEAIQQQQLLLAIKYKRRGSEASIAVLATKAVHVLEVSSNQFALKENEEIGSLSKVHEANGGGLNASLAESGAGAGGTIIADNDSIRGGGGGGGSSFETPKKQAISVHVSRPLKGFFPLRNADLMTNPRNAIGNAATSADRAFPGTTFGYSNLSCPFEWSKYSCTHMLSADANRTKNERASTAHYIRHRNAIRAAYEMAFHPAHLDDGTAGTTCSGGRPARRVLMVGDSLMRQLFISLACHAATLEQPGSGTNGANSAAARDGIIERAEIKWRENGWPCHGTANCVSHGPHSGFDVASIHFKGGGELHFVPHGGHMDAAAAEANILDRLTREVRELGTLTFGKKTALPPRRPLEVLVYNIGIHRPVHVSRRMIAMFADEVGTPLLATDQNRTTVGGSADTGSSKRPRVVYVTTPTQHFDTPDGQYRNDGSTQRDCVVKRESNPRAAMEKEILKAGTNIDALVEYDDFALGGLHVGRGDCSHYCMPGAPDVVAARLLKTFWDCPSHESYTR